jgi:predicted 2-oxoglutarate/Fe(II)-dependent dioxygenase YbiX
MNLRDHILIQKHAVGTTDLLLLANHVRQAQLQDSLVSDFEESVTDGVAWSVNKEIRDTQEVDLPAPIADKLVSLVDASVIGFINPFYRVKVRDAEAPHILHYGPGGHYTAHVDAETLYKDDSGLDLWEKTLDRDLSVVIFLNEDFTGGELVFPALDLVVRPEAGLLVCFPSDHNYIHGVNPVTSGHRYTLVTWLNVAGMPSLDEINEQAMDEFRRAWPRQIKQPPRVAKGGVRNRRAQLRGGNEPE